MHTRRDMMAHSVTVAGLLAAAGFLPTTARAAWPQTAFDARSLADVVKALGGNAPVRSEGVTITAPDIAENGAVVPVEVSTTLPGAERLLLLVEKNPTVLAAVFHLSGVVDSHLSTRTKMAESSNVYGVAMMGDGRVLYAVKEIAVTLGSCVG